MDTHNTIPTTLSEPALVISLEVISLAEQVKDILRKHGCTCTDMRQSTLIVLPNGSVKQELLPRLNVCERYLVSLPGGTKLIDQYDRFQRAHALLSIMPGHQEIR